MDIRSFSNRFRYAWAALLAAMSLLGACKKTSSSGPGEQTLQQYLAGAKQYTLFDHALQRTHLDTLLGGTNPYTVFAVNDSAMTQAGYSMAGIDTANINVLAGILRYNLVPGSVASTNLELYQETIWTTADSSYLAYIEFNNFGVFYNGIAIVSLDNTLVNGMVQGIQTLAKPPLGDLVATVAGTPGLTDFSYILSQAENLFNFNASYNEIVPLISGKPTSPITIFAPGDSYFASLGINSYTAIVQSGGGASTFMTTGVSFTSDFMGANAIPVYNGTQNTGDQMWFSKDGYSFYYENAARLYGQYRILQANIVATNGIIHVIGPIN